MGEQTKALSNQTAEAPNAGATFGEAVLEIIEGRWPNITRTVKMECTPGMGVGGCANCMLGYAHLTEPERVALSIVQHFIYKDKVSDGTDKPANNRS